MIEKLKNIPIDMNGEPSAVWLKINELVDAVNNIVSVQEKLIDSRFVVETKHEAPAENVPEPIKLYVCPDGSVYDNEDFAGEYADKALEQITALEQIKDNDKE